MTRHAVNQWSIAMFKFKRNADIELKPVLLYIIHKWPHRVAGNGIVAPYFLLGSAHGISQSGSRGKWGFNFNLKLPQKIQTSRRH